MEIVSQVVKAHVRRYAVKNDLTEVAVLKQIRAQLDKTSSQYYSEDDPSIDYQDPLCRLGYLHRYAPVHATLFEHVLRALDEIPMAHFCADKGVLNICAMGGGPGTELLGIAKYLDSPFRWMPPKIAFTVFDKVPQWSELWQPLADATEDYLSSS